MTLDALAFALNQDGADWHVMTSFANEKSRSVWDLVQSIFWCIIVTSNIRVMKVRTATINALGGWQITEVVCTIMEYTSAQEMRMTIKVNKILIAITEIPCGRPSVAAIVFTPKNPT